MYTLFCFVFSALQRLVDHIKPQLKGVSFQDLQAFRDRTDGHSNVIKFIESCLKDNENNEAEEREHDRTWFKGIYCSLLTEYSRTLFLQGGNCRLKQTLVLFNRHKEQLNTLHAGTKLNKRFTENV